MCIVYCVMSVCAVRCTNELNLIHEHEHCEHFEERVAMIRRVNVPVCMRACQPACKCIKRKTLVFRCRPSHSVFCWHSRNYMPMLLTWQQNSSHLILIWKRDRLTLTLIHTHTHTCKYSRRKSAKVRFNVQCACVCVRLTFTDLRMILSFVVHTHDNTIFVWNARHWYTHASLCA